MRNENLEKAILKNLQRVEVGLKQKSLICAAEIEMDRYDLTTAEYEDMFISLEDRGLAEKFTAIDGDKAWKITDKGRAVLKGKIA